MAVGLVPIDFANKSSESALSVYPVAIANCKEKRLVFCKSLVLKCFTLKQIKNAGFSISGGNR